MSTTLSAGGLNITRSQLNKRRHLCMTSVLFKEACGHGVQEEEAKNSRARFSVLLRSEQTLSLPRGRSCSVLHLALLVTHPRPTRAEPGLQEAPPSPLALLASAPPRPHLHPRTPRTVASEVTPSALRLTAPALCTSV